MPLIENRSPSRNEDLTESERATVGKDAHKTVLAYLQACPKHAETPLVGLPGLAGSLGVKSIHIKDEGKRLGLVSFKALGGAYAVIRLVQKHAEDKLGRTIPPADLQSDAVRAVAEDMTVTCATDGNHGRSVAAGARLMGCRCVIYVHAGVSEGRAAAIASFGAEIVRTDGNYDESVEEATRTAEREGWTVVSDTSWPGYQEIPSHVMQGYTVMVDEVFRQAPAPFTHIFVQGGVGGVAAAFAGNALDRFGRGMPQIIVVEPTRAACLQLSAIRGKRSICDPDEHTFLAMLECYEPSEIAWAILEKSAAFFLDVGEERAMEAFKALAFPASGDPNLSIGESGAGGLAGLLEVTANEDDRNILNLGPDSRVLLIGTEGATDPELYNELIGSNN